MPDLPINIFISSVQKELAIERKTLKLHISGDPLLHNFFMVFLFEDIAACDRRPDDVYLSQVDRCDIYLGIIGDEYGFEDREGISPTEREFDRASETGKTRLIFIKGEDDTRRHPKTLALMRKAGKELIRKRFHDTREFCDMVSASLVEQLTFYGIIQSLPFEEKAVPAATLDDLDPEVIQSFIHSARQIRHFPLYDNTPLPDLLAHLHLAKNGQLSNAALLLFGRDPQLFFPDAEVRCMHFHGTEIQRPSPDYRIFKGNLFSQVDRSVDFVLSKLKQSVGTRSESARAPVDYEIPPDVVREAIVNAIAHRDYHMNGSVQVSVFSDRIEVWNPGVLIPPLTMESLRHPHGSFSRNNRLCEVLFLARYIEKYGTGTLLMIRECLDYGLPEPDFSQRTGEFIITVWRDWLTPELMSKHGLDERQRNAVDYLKRNARITNSVYQSINAVSRATASRDLDILLQTGLLEKVGTTGKGTHYIIARKRLTNASKDS